MANTGEATERDDILIGGAHDDEIDGGRGNDIIEGGSNLDQLVGGAGHDILLGGSGDDVLTGGDGADVFAFGAECGYDTVADFADGEDLIDLSALAGIAGVDDLQIATFGNTAAIDLTSHGGGTIRLEDTAADDLDASDFVFHEPAADAASIDGM